MKLSIHCANAQERIDTEYLRTCMLRERCFPEFLRNFHVTYDPYDECGAYYAPSQGGPCIKDAGHQDEHFCP